MHHEQNRNSLVCCGRHPPCTLRRSKNHGSKHKRTAFIFVLTNNTNGQDIEVCVPFEDLRQVEEAFSAEAEFCAPFRPGRSYYNKHLAQYSRFKVKGMHQCFFIVPDYHYGLDSKAFDDIMRLPHLDFPLLPLPRYVNGLASVAVRPNMDNNSFVAQIEFLIDGMDIDEKWCHTYLDGSCQDLVKSKSSPSAKQARMGSHPKYEGNLTTYIRNDKERNGIINVVGRVMADHGEFFLYPGDLNHLCSEALLSSPP